GHGVGFRRRKSDRRARAPWLLDRSARLRLRFPDTNAERRNPNGPTRARTNLLIRQGIALSPRQQSWRLASQHGGGHDGAAALPTAKGSWNLPRSLEFRTARFEGERSKDERAIRDGRL